jgi:hypothetical protein
MFEIRWRDPEIRRREAAMAMSSNPLRSTKKSAQIDMIFSPTEYHDISAAWASLVGLPRLFHRLCGRLAARLAESLWPQNSVSKVAVWHVTTPISNGPWGWNLTL